MPTEMLCIGHGRRTYVYAHSTAGLNRGEQNWDRVVGHVRPGHVEVVKNK